MRRTNFFAPTLRETPADATAVSHKLMLRAGLVRMLAAGIYSYLPLGWSTAHKIMNIIREEMNSIGAQELLLPALTPIDVWDETGRSKDFGEIMFRLTDRKNHPYCLAPTHEEIICSLARGHIRSWRDLPQTWYQIQSKFRDETRPRGGMLRMRQFFMKDSYSLDRDEAGLDKSYELHHRAYERIFERCGLNYFIVGASSGLMGGGQSQEFMFESESGEDEVVKCDKCGFAANIEVASTNPPPVPQGKEGNLEEVSTPGKRTVEEVSAFLGIPPGQMVKTLVYSSPSGPIIVLVSGEDEISEEKLSVVAGGSIRPANPEEIRDKMKSDIGFLGPQGDHGLPIFADLRLEETKGMVTGANRNEYHVTGLTAGRDFQPDEYVDLRSVKAGEECPVCGSTVRIIHAIEIGHIFKLGTKYSSAMQANFLDENGQEHPIVMGSYGIGIGRILAAAIEGSADEFGIRWNSAIAPMDAVIIPLGSDDAVIKTSENIYSNLRKAGLDVLIDDRDVRPGVKMKDADLIGIPAHVIVSTRNLAKEQIEVKNRFRNERHYVKLVEVEEAVLNIIEECLP